jgi:hypothetical protein
MSADVPIPPAEARRAAIHRERVEAIDVLRGEIAAFEEREPELRKEIVEFEKTMRATVAELEKTQRTTVAELEKTQRATVAELEKTQRATIAGLEQALRSGPENAEELAEELERTRTELDEELERTRTELDEELARTRSELDDELERTRTELTAELARMRAEHASIGPGLLDDRCKLGMKMSDIALDGDGDEDHEQAIECLQPLLAEFRNHYRRVHLEAERNAAEAKEKLKTLQAEHHDAGDEALALLEERFQPLIDAEVAGVSIEQANVRVARHRLALVDPDDNDALLARELELEAALVERDAARAKVTALHEEQEAAAYHYSHPNAEKSKRLGGKLGKRFGHHH